MRKKLPNKAAACCVSLASPIARFSLVPWLWEEPIIKRSLFLTLCSSKIGDGKMTYSLSLHFRRLLYQRYQQLDQPSLGITPSLKETLGCCVPRSKALRILTRCCPPRSRGHHASLKETPRYCAPIHVKNIKHRLIFTFHFHFILFITQSTSKSHPRAVITLFYSFQFTFTW